MSARVVFGRAFLIVVALAVIGLVPVLLSACIGPPPPAPADRPRPAGWSTLNLPDNVRDLYTFCDHGNRIYTTSEDREAAVAVAAQDPTCKEN